MKHRILIQTNPPWLKTGLGGAGAALMKYLYARRDKFDVAWYCTQVSENDPQLKLTPWKSYGALPSDPQSIQQLNQDPGKARDAAYGSWNIDKVVKDFKPTIWIGLDDAWGFPAYAYMNKPWWKSINTVLHITIDSLPVIEQALEQATQTKHFYTWAKFAMKAMHRYGPKFANVKQIYGAVEDADFVPISETDKQEWRKRFGISPHTVIFNYVFRNQLRKRALLLLQAFGEFKRENPTADVKLHLHTSTSEKQMGWDFPRMIGVYGIDPQSVLFTYVCKQCGQWHVSSYVGDEANCPYCKGEKTMVTVNIVNGVPGNEMKYVYGIADACLSPSNSGGQEMMCNQALLCGKPLASTNYASGEDFCEQPFVFPLGYTADNEPGTNFIKAVPHIADMKKFMFKVWKTSPRDMEEWGKKGRIWAKKTFSIETIGPQWEALFDSLPIVDWSTVNMETPPKDDKFPFPQIEDADKFLTALYTGVLRMEERPDGEGRKHWHAKLKEGMKREDIHNFFLSVARDENTKNNAQKQSQDFWRLLDKTTGRKRGLIVMKESTGDCLMATQLFESFHFQHPNHDLYVACEPKFAEVFDGNPHIFKLLPYQDFMEQEMICMGAGRSDEESFFDVYRHPGIQSQRQLNYLSNNQVAHDLLLT